MARGDATWGRVDIDWPDDPRSHALSDAENWRYIVIRLWAIRERTNVLPAAYTISHCARRLNVQPKSIEKLLERCKNADPERPILFLDADGRICLPNLGKQHEKLSWKGSREGPRPPHTLPIRGGYGQQTDRTDRPTPLTPPTPEPESPAMGKGSGLRAAVTGVGDKDGNGSRASTVSPAVLDLLREHGRRCQDTAGKTCVDPSVIDRLMLRRNYPPEWLLGWLLYQQKQKTDRPVAYLHGLLRLGKMPQDDLFREAEKMVREAEASGVQQPPVQFASEVKTPAVSIPDGGSFEENRRKAQNYLSRVEGRKL